MFHDVRTPDRRHLNMLIGLIFVGRAWQTLASQIKAGKAF